ncbi:hypothetical protein ACNOYE_10635 [Nannocystaceae bacterium ST9]
MTRPERHLDASATDGPGIVVLHWSRASAGLLDELARTMAGAGVARITCVGEVADAPELARADGIEVRWIALDPATSGDALVERMIGDVRIVEAHSVIVLPHAGIDDPDSSSRLTCAAIRRACGARVGPNVLVEIEDPEAAFEFVGLGVATVFYSGHLRAALLGQACVDLGVFQFVVGLLRGRHHVRSIPIPVELREASFADAALSLELDERGLPMTVIGITKPAKLATAHHVLINPGPRTSLRDALGLMVLIAGDEGETP